MMGCGGGLVSSDDRAEHEVFCKIKPCHSAAEDPAPLSYGANWIYQTQYQGLP